MRRPTPSRRSADARTRRLLAALLAAAGLGACGGEDAGERGSETAPAPDPAAPPAPEVAARAEVSGEPAADDAEGHLPALVTDLVVGGLCPRLLGSFTPLTVPGEPGTLPRVVGRLWIRECRASRSGAAVAIDVRASGWRWVERARNALGAEFELRDYLRFRADVALRARAELLYAPEAAVATLRLHTVGRPDIAVDVFGDTDVESGWWGDVVGTAAALVGQSPRARAEESFADSATRIFQGHLYDGVSAAMDLCTGQTFASMGTLPAGAIHRAHIDPAPAAWLASGRVRLEAEGLDVVGPFDTGAAPLHVRVEANEGVLRAGLVCADAARAAAAAYLEKGSLAALPDLDAAAEARVAAGETVTLRAETESCPRVLIAAPARGAETPVEFGFLTWGDGEPEPLVACASASGGASGASAASR